MDDFGDELLGEDINIDDLNDVTEENNEQNNNEKKEKKEKDISNNYGINSYNNDYDDINQMILNNKNHR